MLVKQRVAGKGKKVKKKKRSKMAARKNVKTQCLGQFHPKCSDKVTLSKDRRLASGDPLGAFFMAFSNDPIQIGQKFSIKILQSSAFVSQCILQLCLRT